MRLNEWRAKAPFKDSVAPKVTATIDAALGLLGAEADPECWIVWGDDPLVRYVIFVPTAAGLLQVNVRVAVPGEGPRASGKVIRWNRIQLGELAIEIQAGHRLVTFQVEAQPLNGADAAADAIASFAHALLAAADGRPAATPVRSMRRPATTAKAATKPATKPTGSPASTTRAPRLAAPKAAKR